MADGFEEIEALATVDILRRGGIATRMVSNTESLLVTGAHHIGVQADMSFSAFAAAGAGVEDVLVFPGGLPGAQHLADNGVLMDIMRRHDAEGGLVAAICAAPGLVVAQLDTLQDKKFTCYTGFEPALLAGHPAGSLWQSGRPTGKRRHAGRINLYFLIMTRAMRRGTLVMIS